MCISSFYNDRKQLKRLKKDLIGMPCPECSIKLPKTNPKVLLPNQKCWCGYIDNRPRMEGNKNKAKQLVETFNNKYQLEKM